MPVALDEYPIHQSALSMAQVATTDRNFYDRCYFNAFDPAGGPMLVTGLGMYPNLGVIDAYAVVRHGDRQHAVRFSDALHDNRLDQRVGPRDDAVLHLPGAECGEDLLLDDHAGEGVGEHALEAVADLHAHLPLLGRDQQDRAVVLGLLADPPGAAELVAVLLDLVALQVGHGGHHQLAAGLGLERREPAVVVAAVHQPTGNGRRTAHRRSRQGGNRRCGVSIVCGQGLRDELP